MKHTHTKKEGVKSPASKAPNAVKPRAVKSKVTLPAKGKKVANGFDGQRAERKPPAGQPELNNNDNKNTMTNDTAACCTTAGANSDTPSSPSDLANNSALPIDQRVSQLETNVDRLNYRQSYQEHLHRNVREDGNITHYYNIIPTVIISAGVGAVLGFSINALIGFIKRKMG